MGDIGPPTAPARSKWAQLSANYEHQVLSVSAFAVHRERILGEIRPGRVADLGCGPTGRLLRGIASLPDTQAIGLDFCREMIAESRKKNEGIAVQYVEGDLRALPFRNGAIDAAISVNSFVPETRIEAEEMFREAARVLRTGGRLLAVLPAFEMSVLARDRWGMDVAIDTEAHREWDTLGWQTFYTVGDIEEVVARCGFSRARIDTMEFSSEAEVAHIFEVYSGALNPRWATALTEFPLFEHLLVADR